MPANYTEIEKRLWEAADELRANSKLKPLKIIYAKLCMTTLSSGTVEARELEERIAENVAQLLSF